MVFQEFQIYADVMYVSPQCSYAMHEAAHVVSCPATASRNNMLCPPPSQRGEMNATAQTVIFSQSSIQVLLLSAQNQICPVLSGYSRAQISYCPSFCNASWAIRLDQQTCPDI